MTTIILPAITTGFVLDLYEFWTLCEVKKTIGWYKDHAEGQQDGYLFCLNHMFGTLSEAEYERALNDGKTIIHVAEKIIVNLQNEINDFNYKDKLEYMEKWMQLREKVRTLVEQYVTDHY